MPERTDATCAWRGPARWLVDGLHRLVFALALLILPAAVAANCDLPETLQTNIPPGGLNVATPVRASFVVVDFMGVDDANQSIEIDFFVQMSWQDPRLAGLSGCRFSTTEVWVPRIRLLNSDNLRRYFLNARDQVAISENGVVTYAQRFTGPVSSYHSLRQFPFDAHRFSIDFISFNDPENLIEYIGDDENTWIGDRLNIEGWEVGEIGLHIAPYTFSETGTQVEGLSLQIAAKRNPDYYVYRVISLLALVVAMSWVIFWVPPNRFEFQIGIGATTMLTAMAFIFAISNQLPPVGYLTILDRMVIWAIVLIFLSIVESLVAGRMVLAEKEARALSLDRVSRVIFPALLAGGWAYLIYA